MGGEATTKERHVNKLATIHDKKHSCVVVRPNIVSVLLRKTVTFYYVKGYKYVLVSSVCCFATPFFTLLLCFCFAKTPLSKIRTVNGS